MKHPPRTRTTGIPSSVRLLVPAFSMAALSAIAATADSRETRVLANQEPEAAVTKMEVYAVNEQQSDKTHTLFMGADIAVNLGRDLYRVRDVFGSNWVVEINGQQKEISSKQAPLNLKITPILKLTEGSATIQRFKKEAAYSFKNDPSVRMTRKLSEAAITNGYLMGNANDAQYVADTQANKALGFASVLATSDNESGAAAMLADAQSSGMSSHITTPAEFMKAAAAAAAFSLATAQGTATANLSQTENGDELGGRLVETGLDAMDVEFDISSARPLQKPYIVTLARFHPKGTKPGTAQNLVYAKELHPIDAHLSHVHFTETGFPFNYELLDFQMHIYNWGEEIATNVSNDRLEMTRDEAFEYVKAEYVGAHPKDTMPAVPAMGRMPADLHAVLASGKYADAFYVKVSKEGLANEAYADAACTKRIEDSYLDSVVRRVRFKPALNVGKPVDGVASLTLGRLTI